MALDYIGSRFESDAAHSNAIACLGANADTPKATMTIKTKKKCRLSFYIAGLLGVKHSLSHRMIQFHFDDFGEVGLDQAVTQQSPNIYSGMMFLEALKTKRHLFQNFEATFVFN